jgi:RluA family pseudouridine synthase
MMSSGELAARILYRDDALIVLDKPAGIAVHAGSGRNDALDRHFEALKFGLSERPELAHRLDKDTSGCLALGRHRAALARLGGLFQRGRVTKVYWAVVAGLPATAEGLIDLALARRSHDRRSWIMKVAEAQDAAAEAARTRFRVLAAGDGLSLVEFRPETGRTHQLRVHAAVSGWPIAGDPLYGGDRARALARHLHLHARRLVIPYGHNAPPIDVTAPMPDHMAGLVRLAGFTGEAA